MNSRMKHSRKKCDTQEKLRHRRNIESSRFTCTRSMHTHVELKPSLTCFSQHARHTHCLFTPPSHSRSIYPQQLFPILQQNCPQFPHSLSSQHKVNQSNNRTRLTQKSRRNTPRASNNHSRNSQRLQTVTQRSHKYNTRLSSGA